MRQFKLNSSQSAYRATWFSGMLLYLACVLALAPQALAQTASATDHAPAPQNLRDTPLGHSHTPMEVVNGTAKFVSQHDPNSTLRLTLGLTPPKLAEEEQFLQTLQDRNSQNFHKYLTAEQWNARFAPAAQDEQAVVDWLTNNGLTVTQRYANRLVVDAEGPSQAIEKAFAIQINDYQTAAVSGFSNDRDPVIPAHLVGILHSIGGLNNLQRAHAPHEDSTGAVPAAYSAGPVFAEQGSRYKNGNPAALTLAQKATEAKSGSSALKSLAHGSSPQPGITNGYIDPSDIFSSNGYDYGALMAQGHCCNPLNNSGGSPNTTSIAIATAGDFADSDFDGFQAQYPYLAYYYYRTYVDGTPSCCNDETTLDLEWAVATANSEGSYQQTARVYVYEGANSYLSTFTDVYNKMLSDGNARIFSTSWGCAELTCADSGTMDTDHAIFNSMLGQGWTILALSHDYGATGGCDDALRVTYPGSDPDATSVGGTTLELYSDGTFDQETAWEGGTSSGSCSHNNGGSGGGCSAYFSAPGYQSNPYCGSGSRSVPDIALNAGAGQNYYFNGSLSGVGGTSIATPQAAGFMAQENAYLLAIDTGCGSGYTSVCAPMGEVNYPLYTQGPGAYAPHYPFYDITVGCNNNDITAEYGLGYYCAGTGYDAITGWGSFNALQLAWSINWYYTGDFGAPKITFSGPPVSTTSDTWYNTDQTVSWTVVDTNNGTYPSNGVAGFSQAWDSPISDAYSEPTEGTGNSFYSGPQFPNATSGYLQLSWAGQGCHYAAVDAWDNTGLASGNQYYYYICYDTVAPTAAAANNPAPNSKGYNKQSVGVTLTAADPGGSTASGVSHIYYSVNSTACTNTNLGACAIYSSPLTISTPGFNYVLYFSKDVAGNISGYQYDFIYIDEQAPVTTASLSGSQSGSVYDSAVQVTLNPTDNFSGVATTVYSVDGGSFVTYAAPFSISKLGTHTVKFYSTDNAGNVESTKSIGFSISAATNTLLSVSPNPATSGTVTASAKVTANLGASPTGTITFKSGTTVLATATLSGGTASAPIHPAFGSTFITASYGGATNILGSVSASVDEIYKDSTTTTLTSSPSPSTLGESVTLKATVKPGSTSTPTGEVQFFNGSKLLGGAALSGGVATYATTVLPVGSDLVHAVYQGSISDAVSSSSSVTQVVQKGATTTTLATSASPSQYGVDVTFTATVTGPAGSPAGTPTGTVLFKADGTSLGSVSLAAGKASVVNMVLTPGTHTITATYSGSTEYNASVSSNLSQVISTDATTTTLTSSLNPSTSGQKVTFTAKVAAPGHPTPTGTVQFKDGTTVLGSAGLSSGTATFSTTSLATGSHSITAVYSGAADFATSTSSVLSETVNQ